MTSRATLRAYVLAAVLTLAWLGVWTALFAGGQGEPLFSTAARLIILVAPLLVGAGWLLAGRLKSSGRTNEIPGTVADLTLIDDLNRAANTGEHQDQLLARLAEGTRAAFSSRGATVYLLDDAQEYLVLLGNPTSLVRDAGITLPAGFGRPRIRLASSTWYAGALQAAGPIVTSRFDEIVAMAVEFEGADKYQAILPVALRALRMFSVMTVPVLSGGRVLGLVDMSRDWPFTDQEVERFKVICEEVAVVLARIDAEDRLREALEAKSRFLANMSHELRTPLNSIIGFAGVMEQGLAGPLTDEQRTQLSMVSKSGRHLLRLVDDILDLARIEAGQSSITLARFDLCALAGEVAAALAPQTAAKGIALRVAAPPEPLEIVSDSAKVEQVLINLANNAVKFTESGEVRIECTADGPGVSVAVSDTGIGILPEELGLIMDDFHQVDRLDGMKPSGTGLGLAISRRLVAMLGGRLEIESEPGSGSMFRVWLPDLADDSGAGEK